MHYHTPSVTLSGVLIQKFLVPSKPDFEGFLKSTGTDTKQKKRHFYNKNKKNELIVNK